jgi:uncharacterized protein DUF4129
MTRKHRLLVFGLIALAAVAVLASSLHDVHFEPGRALSSPRPTTSLFQPASVAVLPGMPLWKLILVWVLFTLNVVLFFYLLPPELRKRILRQVARFSIGALILLIALRNRLLQLPDLSGEPANGGPSAGDLGPKAEVPVFQPPAATSWSSYLISLTVMAVLLLLAWAGYRWWLRSRARYLSLGTIAEISRSSLDDLHSGRDWGDVIIQSYVRMSEAVSSRRGLARPEAMTPREFAQRLEHAGLPGEAVRRLTRLFESVRYGAGTSSQSDVTEAVACLDSILQACGAAQ